MIKKSRRGRNYWSFATVMAEASQYETRTDFKQKGKGAHTWARKHGRMDEVCAHMRAPSSWRRALYVFEFSDHSAYIGLTCDYDRRTNQHAHANRSVQHKIAQEKVRLVQFNEWYAPEIAAQKERELIEQYRYEGWTILNKNRGGGLGGKHLKWTLSRIRKEVSKYTLHNDFHVNSPGAYAAARKLGVLAEITKGLVRKNALPLTAEEVREEAKRYSSPKEFKKHRPQHYGYAYQTKMMVELYGVSSIRGPQSKVKKERPIKIPKVRSIVIEGDFSDLDRTKVCVICKLEKRLEAFVQVSKFKRRETKCCAACRTVARSKLSPARHS